MAMLRVFKFLPTPNPIRKFNHAVKLAVRMRAISNFPIHHTTNLIFKMHWFYLPHPLPWSLTYPVFFSSSLPIRLQSLNGNVELRTYVVPGHRFILNLIPTQHNFNRHLPLVNLWWRISFGSRPQQHFFGPGEYVKICVRELKTYEFCSPAKALTERANTTRQRRGIQGGQVNIKEVCSGFHMDVHPQRGDPILGLTSKKKIYVLDSFRRFLCYCLEIGFLSRSTAPLKITVGLIKRPDMKPDHCDWRLGVKQPRSKQTHVPNIMLDRPGNHFPALALPSKWNRVSTFQLYEMI